MKHAEDETNTGSSANLPMRLEPLMVAHLALTGDAAQQREWRQRIEAILQTDAVERENDPETRALLLRDSVWRRMRETGKVGATFNLALASLWMAWLIPLYAVGHGFGWPAALTYLLPVPLAWKLGRKLFERGALAGMRELKHHDDLPQRVSVFARSISRSLIAGFGFGFTLVGLQELISAFMTPLPTIWAELTADFVEAVIAGSICGVASVALAPLLARTPPK